MNFESENTEYKSAFTDEIYKTVIAFANTGGGTLFIGVNDSGEPIGLDNLDDTYTRITNGIRDAISPDVTVFVKYSLESEKVIKIEVNEGAFKPYYLKSKGLKPSGVYVRQGASSVPASSDMIRQMIKDSDGDVFENMRSLEQNLSFNSAKTAFEKYGIEFSEEKYRALGVVNASDMLYTNLALLLSDQCGHTIKAAVFDDESNTRFKDSKEFSGSIFKQLEDAFSYLMLCNRVPAEIKGLTRTEHPDYPEEALREALLNALVHRDYSFSGSIIININEKETEFISLGGLLQGLSVEDIKKGISQPRNKNLAEVFHRLRLIESYGTGIRRIYKLYENCTAKPKLEISPNVFKLVLPNMNYNVSYNEITAHDPTEQQAEIIEYIRQHGSINDTGIQNLLGVKKTRAYIIAKKMLDAQMIVKQGKGINKIYMLP